MYKWFSYLRVTVVKYMNSNAVIADILYCKFILFAIKRNYYSFIILIFLTGAPSSSTNRTQKSLIPDR